MSLESKTFHMKYIPSPRPFRLTVAYGIILLLLAVATMTSLYAPTSYQGIGVISTVLLAFGTFAFMERRRLKEFGYDEMEVYRWGKSMFSWVRVHKMSLNFKESDHTLTTVARPTLSALLSGPLVNRATWVDYGISMLFSLDDGSSISIPSNLDKMTSEGMIEDIHELAKAANPSIEIE